MGRLSAVFVAFCMLLIAISVGLVTYLSFGFSGVEAAVIAIAVMTALVMVNSVTTRQRDRYDVGSQIADLSRGTADMARQVSELDRRLVAIENDVVVALERSRAQTAPLANEIGELGGLVKDLADAVAAHEQMLESAIANATPQRPAPMSDRSSACSVMRRRSAIASACAVRVFGSTTRNSSPPMRPSRSGWRSASWQARATRARTWSPTRWPQASLMRLKWSMSRISALSG